MALVDSLAAQIGAGNTTAGSSGMSTTGSALASSGTAAFGDFISIGLQNWFNKQANQESREFAEKQSRDAWNREYQLYNEQLAYNTPASQMERFKAAGLNPNLVYGQGTPGNAPASSPNYQKPNWQAVPLIAPQLGQTINQYYDFKLKQATLDTMIEQRKNIVADRALKITANMLKGFEVDLWEAGKIDYMQKFWDVNLQNMAANMGWTLQRTEESKEKQKGYVYQRNLWASQEAYNAARKAYTEQLGKLVPGQMQMQQANLANMWAAQQVKLKQMRLMQENISWWAKKNKMFEDAGSNIDRDSWLMRKFDASTLQIDNWLNGNFSPLQIND